MRFILFYISTLLILSGCKEQKKQLTPSVPTETTSVNIKYAKGFSIRHFNAHKEITITRAWPKSKDTLRYLLVDKEYDIPSHNNKTTVIKTPISKVVVMSTTNIPTLEYLNVDTCLIGFPNTKFISSEKTRKRIDNGDVKDLNNDLDINMELLLELAPELVIGFSVNGNDKTLNQIEKFNIPVVLDGAWTEEHPLGKAEWIKFIAAFFNKEKEADSIFKTIESSYLKAKKLALNAPKRPSVLSGSMFKDVWNVPGGKSFMATYFKDANTRYLWETNQNTGSLQLNFENVLQKAQQANFWIGAGNFDNKEQMANSSKGYVFFDAFKDNNIYTYTNKVGPKGGLLFYELGSLRPDIILKDIIKIAHPELLKNYDLYFFKRLE
ncbi:ABC transporter substrate-binding protein [Aestuariivivens insulae]|uniref:ABC transporter substrate-binding protein n=1 Tax=Aestuariivivens insulae TaxID=1621988 RepID=UPI001F55FDAC|nr:ABC transporter substrate-binding protein [Aestuariivivens insulae]